MIAFKADCGKRLVVAPSGVAMSYDAGSALLSAYNELLSPIPLAPWPAFLEPVEETIAARASLHAALIELGPDDGAHDASRSVST